MEKLTRYSHKGRSLLNVQLLSTDFFSPFESLLPICFCQVTVEKLYNVLLFPDGGWMVDQGEVCAALVCEYLFYEKMGRKKDIELRDN